MKPVFFWLLISLYATFFLNISLKFVKSFRKYEDFLRQYFLKFPCCKETNDISIWQMMSTYFLLKVSLKRLFNNCIKLYCYCINPSWNMNRGSNWPPPAKTAFKKPRLIRVNYNLSDFSFSDESDDSNKEYVKAMRLIFFKKAILKMYFLNEQFFKEKILKI